MSSFTDEFLKMCSRFECQKYQKVKNIYLNPKAYQREQRLKFRKYQLYNETTNSEGITTTKRISRIIPEKHKNPIVISTGPSTVLTLQEQAFLMKREAQREIYMTEIMKNGREHNWNSSVHYQKALDAYKELQNLTF